MSRWASILAHDVWLAAGYPEWRRFQHAVQRVEEEQAHLLQTYLRANRNTSYGRRHDFAALRSPADYQRRVPLTTYDDYSADVEAIGQGQVGVLTAEPVRMFELSSGSSAASKLIPYTAGLKAEFQRGLAAWIFDLYTHVPALKGGPAYWSITPLTPGPRVTSAGLSIGFEEDSAYLGPLGQPLVETLMAVPNVVKHIDDVAAFRYATLLFLLRRPELRLISVWNPTFLSLLLEPLPRWWEQLLDDLASGSLHPPAPLAPAASSALQRYLRPAPRRAAALRRLSPTDYSTIWPRLGLLSCWADGPSAAYARRLTDSYFPRTPLQGKGLLATEAFVSFPLWGVEDSVLSVHSHFFEFLPEGETAREPYLAHQLERGQTYAVVVTTGGGLYRYQLHDLVEVTGHVGQAPRLRFVGKQAHVSDWFGEKLNERFVAQTLEQLFALYQLAPAFALLAPDDAPEGFRYTLYLELPSVPPPTLAADLDHALCENFHYDYCRKLGQLSTAQVYLTAPNAADAYLRACQARGQKLGNVKPMLLQKTTGWGVYF